MVKNTLSDQLLQQLHASIAALQETVLYKERIQSTANDIRFVCRDCLKTLALFHRENERMFKKKLKNDLDTLELFMLEHVTLYSILLPGINPFSKRKRNQNHKQFDAAIQTFTLLLINAIHSLMAITQMLSAGLQIQALAVIRVYQETFETAIAILVSDRFLSIYRSEPANKAEEKSKWWAVRPQAVLKIISEYYARHKKSELWEEWRTYRNEHYTYLSQGSHPQYIAIGYNAFPTLVGTKRVVPGFGGTISNAIASTLRDFIIQSRLVFDMAQHHLAIRYPHIFKRMDDTKRLYRLVHQINRKLFHDKLLQEQE